MRKRICVFMKPRRDVHGELHGVSTLNHEPSEHKMTKLSLSEDIQSRKSLKRSSLYENNQKSIDVL